ncbi:MAG: hypothetical protein LBG17_08920 [Bacteroidales bacterium]|jgi:hypothetical protein|nr:hypothetical protein [Bacteroidales bacterium]
MKNKVGLALIISGAALMLLVTVAFLWIRGEDKTDVTGISPLSLKVPENSFVEDVTFEITDTPEIIDDTVFIERDIAPKEEPVKRVKNISKRAKNKPENTYTERTEYTEHREWQPAVQSKTAAQKPSRAGFTNDFTIGGTKVRVEFWNPDKNFLGYHLSLSQKKILLFGIKQFDPLRFEKYGEKQIIMYYKNTPYLLEEKLDIEPLQKLSVE